jgi:tRNA threonylcarbamoyladenosine biosynthesis protein TsaB
MHPMSLTLALECSSPRSNWALVDGPSTVAQGATEGRASAAFFASIHDHWPANLQPQHILVGVGPGSFSGIRVALSAALGMSRAWGCPVIPVRSTHALGLIHADQSHLGIFSDAKRGLIFYTAYNKGIMTVPSCLISKAEFQALQASCSLALALGPLEGLPETAHPAAENLVHSWQNQGPEPNLPLEPIYLHQLIVSDTIKLG